MTTVLPISKRGTVTLPPALRQRFGFGADRNALVILEERDGEFVLRPAAAVAVRDIPQSVIDGWVSEDAAGMEAFLGLNETPK